jgi:hypothetical protein
MNNSEPNTRKVCLRLSDDAVRSLRAVSKAQGITRSALLRKLVDDGLTKYLPQQGSLIKGD